ncbi:MAG: dCTP deaminase [Actinobacteria bacterium]|nr:dCTP deaminase [Actinomycetota bacterium]
MILSDGTIRELLATGRLSIAPIEPDQVQPASVDVRLGDRFLVFRNHTIASIDPFATSPDLMQTVQVAAGEPFILHPGEFVLGSTLEVVTLPDDLVARVEGKSSLGRLGLLIHATAGFVDPGFSGQVTLEFSNVSPLPIKLWPLMRIGQLSFQHLDRPCERPYGHPELGSKYAGQLGPVGSRYAERPPGGELLATDPAGGLPQERVRDEASGKRARD